MIEDRLNAPSGPPADMDAPLGARADDEASRPLPRRTRVGDQVE